jgi:dienelactone hydrolase
MPLRTARRCAVALLVVSSLVAGCGGSTPDPKPSPTSTGDPAGLALAYQVPKMTSIVATTEAYAEADGQPLELNLFLPPGKERSPAVLLLHGVTRDASPKDYAGHIGWGQALARSGVAAVVINYRAEESGSGPGNADIQAAIEHMRRDKRLDMSAWGMLTFSAGGPYGVRAAADAPEGLAAAGFFYARTEKTSGDPSPETSLTALVKRRPELAFLAAYGALDQIPGITTSRRRLQAEVGRTGSDNVQVLVHPTAGHAFDTIPGEDNEAIVRATVEFFVEQLIS